MEIFSHSQLLLQVGDTVCFGHVGCVFNIITMANSLESFNLRMKISLPYLVVTVQIADIKVYVCFKHLQIYTIKKHKLPGIPLVEIQEQCALLGFDPFAKFY